jgi:hypothetical protein
MEMNLGLIIEAWQAAKDAKRHSKIEQDKDDNTPGELTREEKLDVFVNTLSNHPALIPDDLMDEFETLRTLAVGYIRAKGEPVGVDRGLHGGD